MEINLNSNGFGNIGMGRESFDATSVGAGNETKGASGIDAGRGTHDKVTFTRAQPSGIASSEPVADVPDAALDRDDALGKLMNAAFNLPPPPMPSFST